MVGADDLWEFDEQSRGSLSSGEGEAPAVEEVARPAGVYSSKRALQLTQILLYRDATNNQNIIKSVALSIKTEYVLKSS